MKNIITILCLVLLSIAGTQNTQAQTKEETIQWLNDYGTKFTFTWLNECNDELIGFDGEFIKYESKCVSELDNSGSMYSYKVLPKDILYQDISALNENSFEYEGLSKKYWRFRIKTKPDAVIKYDSSSPANNRSSFISICFESKDQQKDAIRLIKAIMNLAKLSGADELPKVTEETF